MKFWVAVGAAVLALSGSADAYTWHRERLDGQGTWVSPRFDPARNILVRGVVRGKPLTERASPTGGILEGPHVLAVVKWRHARFKVRYLAPHGFTLIYGVAD